MPSSSSRRRSKRPSPPSTKREPAQPLPLVEIVLSGVDSQDLVSEAFVEAGTSARLLACRPMDRGRRRLVRLFEVQAAGEGLAPLMRKLRSRVAARDLAVAHLGPGRALLWVSGAMPPECASAFALGDFCIGCRFQGRSEAGGRGSWRVLVPQIGDARQLLSAAERRGIPRPSLTRAGAHRRQWGLTARQEKALRLAFQLGYFGYPRKIPLSALANSLGVSRSTALELLRKATTKVAAERFLSEPPVEGPL